MVAPDPIAFSIFGIDIMWYGVLIGTGFLLAVAITYIRAPKFGIEQDFILTITIAVIPSAIIGARLYYVIFTWDMYKDDLMKIFDIRSGGLAIHGGLILSFIVAYFLCRKHGVSFLNGTDLVAPVIPLAQAIGRWGNFFNREAFGGFSDGLFAMRYQLSQVSQSNLNTDIINRAVTVNGVEYIQVHPTFLYESLWNIGVFIALILLRKSGKFKNGIFAWYLILYGLGRTWIEGMRIDSLYLFGSGIRVSQALSMLMVIAGAALLVYFKRKERSQSEKADRTV